jgi:hypothetical protein
MPHSGLGSSAVEDREQRLWGIDAALALEALRKTSSGGGSGVVVDQAQGKKPEHDFYDAARNRQVQLEWELSGHCSLAVCQSQRRDKGVPGQMSLATAGSIDQFTR